MIFVVCIVFVKPRVYEGMPQHCCLWSFDQVSLSGLLGNLAIDPVPHFRTLKCKAYFSFLQGVHPERCPEWGRWRWRDGQLWITSLCSKRSH